MDIGYRALKKSDLKYVIDLVETNLGIIIKKSFKGSFDYDAFSNRILREGKSYIIWHNCEKCGFIWYTTRKEILHVNTIVIHKPYQGMGIGKRVFKDIEELARKKKLKYIHLGVQGVNENARLFYKKIGFEYTGAADEFDTYYMRKKLS